MYIGFYSQDKMADIIKYCIITTLYLSVSIISAQDEALITYDIPENLGKFTFVGNVATNSNVDQMIQPPDDVDSLEFAILTPATSDPEKYFTIDTKQGVLRTNKVIDRDVICSQQETCSLGIRVAVVSTKSNFILIIRVTVNIVDANDNAPKFIELTVIKSIPENTPVKASISIPSAEDPDSPKYGISHYAMTSSVAEFSLKQVNNTDGSVALYLVVEDKLDREVKDFYSIVVAAYDKGDLSGTLTVDINIKDVNDNHPEFTPAEYVTNVDENMKNGSVVIQVIAQDKDLGANSEIIYDFDAKTKADFGPVFTIDNKTGEIKLKSELDYEKKIVYNLVVTAKELHHETLPAEAKVVVNVNDINDNPPIITTSSLQPNVEVLENAPVGTFVAHLFIQDPDKGNGGKFSCQLQNNIDNKFKLDSINPKRTEFKISTNYIFNREKQQEYTLLFVCTDEGAPALTATSQIRVTIIDKNDNAPKFAKQVYEVEVSENNPKGLFLTQVLATDPDFGVNGQVEYALYTEAMSYINVDPISGNITANEVFDYEKYHTLSFGIIAKDKGKESHQTTAILNIKIQNENDEPPSFSTSYFQFRVNETRPPFTILGRLTIKERDPALNNVTFAFKANSKHRDLFSLDPHTGIMYTKAGFDADDNSADFFEIEVVVMDSVHTNLQSGAVVSVKVLDLNDNRPYMTFHNAINNTISVASDFPRGQVVTTIKGTDKDSGLNAELIYMIESGNNDQYFTLGETSGELRTMRSLTHIQQRTFILTISAHDKGDLPLTDVQVLKIRVNNSLSAAVPSTSDLVGSNNLTIVVVVAVISAILIVVLIVSIVILQRKDKIRIMQKQRRLSKLYYDQKAVVQQTRPQGGVVEKTPSFDSIVKVNYSSKDLSYSNEINTSDECPVDYQIGYPLDQKSNHVHKDEEADSQLSDHSGADSGRGSNDDPDLTTSHMSIIHSGGSQPLIHPKYPNNHHQSRAMYSRSTSSPTQKSSHPPQRSGSHRDVQAPVIPERRHKSHTSNLDTRGYFELPVTRIPNNNSSSSTSQNTTNFKQSQQSQRNTSSNYKRTELSYPSDPSDKRTPSHTDESYVVNPHPSYI